MGESMKSSSEISQDIANKENELKKAIEADYIVEQAILNQQRQILNLQHSKKELEIARSKSNHTIKQIKLEISTMTKEFWNTKNQGL